MARSSLFAAVKRATHHAWAIVRADVPTGERSNVPRSTAPRREASAFAGVGAFAGVEGKRVGNVLVCGEHCAADALGFIEAAAETVTCVDATIAAERGRAVRRAHG